MASPVKVQDSATFFKLLQRSGVLEPSQLAAVEPLVQQSPDPKPIAKQLIKKEWLTTWQAAQLLAGWHGLKMGKFHLLRQLGKSETGRVFLAEHQQLGRRVALKTLSKRHTDRPERVAQFLNDARTAGAMDHRNIVHVYDVDSDDDRFFVSMEYVEGQDLLRLIQAEGPMSPLEVAEVIRQVADGLKYAHAKGMSHRDLKPSNLVRDEKGVVKIMDLGVGGLVDHAELSQEAYTGHCEYLAPEQLDSLQDVGPPADVYALGCIAYFLATGKPPIRAANDHEAAQAQLKKQAPALTRRIKDFPPEISALCQKMLLKEPAKRPAASSVESALADWLEHHQPTPVLAVGDGEEEYVELSEVPDSKAARPRKAKPLTEAASQEAPGNQALGGVAEVAISVTEAAPQLDSPVVIHDAAAGAVRGTRTIAPSKAKPISLTVIIGSVLGVLLTIGLLVALAIVLLRPGGNQVAQNPDDPAAATETEPAADPDDTDDPADEPGADEDPQEPDEPNSAEPNPAEPDPAEPNPAEPDPAEPSAETSLADLLKESNNKPKPEPEADPAADPKAGEPNGGDPKAGDPANGADPKAADPKAADPKAADPKAADPPKPPPRPALDPKYEKPFSQFPATLALPKVDAEPQVLGSILLAPERICFIKLKGGDKAYRGTQVFSMANARNGTAEREWEVTVQNEKAEAGGQVVARLTLADDQLTFQWTPEAADEPAAAHLCNCLLSMNIGSATHQTALRQPIDYEAFRLDLDKVSSTRKCAIEFPPDPMGMRVEVMQLEGAFPKHVKDPDAAIPANRGSQWISFGETAADQILAIKLESTMKRDLQLNLLPHFRIPGSPEPLKFSKSNVQKVSQSATNIRNQLEAQLNQLQAAAKQLGRAAGGKGVNAQIALVEQKKAQAELAIQAIEKLRGVYEAVNNAGQIHFRVIYETEAGPVELVRTVSAAPLEEPNKR